MDYISFLRAVFIGVLTTVLSGMFVLDVILTDFFYADGYIVLVSDSFNGVVNLFSFCTLTVCFIWVLNIMLKEIESKLKGYIEEKLLSKETIANLWLCFLGVALFVILSIAIAVSYDSQMTNISSQLYIANSIVKPVLFVGLALSVFSYLPIDLLYLSYCDKIKDSSHEQKEALQFNATVMKIVAFVVIFTTGWTILPLFYFYFLLFKTYKRVKKM